MKSTNVQEIIKEFERERPCEHHPAQRCNCADSVKKLRRSLTSLLTGLVEEIEGKKHRYGIQYSDMRPDNQTESGAIFNAALDEAAQIIKSSLTTPKE